MITASLVVVTLVAFFYGIGQNFWGFPAFLTGNEEFSKGTPLRLAEGARIPSLFAGHYDLSAYLVLVIPVFFGVMFAVKRWWIRIILFTTAVLGYILLLLTASRISFAALLVGITFLFFFMKKKKLIIPALIVAILISFLFEGMTERFGKTISQVDLVVDARTGQAVGVAGSEGDDIVVEDKTPEGDDLKTGSGFINIRGDGAKGTAKEIVYKRSRIGATGDEEEVTTIEGDFIIKSGFAYDVSFTTRFQGTWPRAISAFDRNPLLGSGYSTINLASDNNYLRMLGETGAIGIISFISIFTIFAIYVYRTLGQVKSKAIRAFAIGISAGIVGLSVNALLIDVFAASKVAFTLYFLMGLTVGMLHLYQKKKIPYMRDLRRVFLSYPAISIYLILASFLIYRVNFDNFFVADDFTWLRWAEDCSAHVAGGLQQCSSALTLFQAYFTESDGFFYRPGTKVYFNLIYSLFSLDVNKYHYVSTFLHAATAIGLFFTSLKFLKNKISAGIISLVWLALGIHYEEVFWISATGHLICFAAIVYSLVFFMYAQKRKRAPFIILSIIASAVAPLFHEVGIIAPILVLSYYLLFEKNLLSRKILLFIPYLLIPPAYLVLRYLSGSHWSGGDYSYNLVLLPLNFFGNAMGYLAVTLGGPDALPYYDAARLSLRDNITVAAGLALAALVLTIVAALLLRKYTTATTQKITIFTLIFFFLTLLPFLGLGNITPRYVYLASFAPIFILGYIIFHGIEKIKRTKVKLSVFLVALFAIVAFMYFQIGQTIERSRDWEAASIITENFIIDFYDHYPDYEAFENKRTFYFVDAPIKYRSAWIFPTGLEDPLYFALNTAEFKIIQVDEITEEMRDDIEARRIQLFIFNESGRVEELTRQAVPVQNE